MIQGLRKFLLLQIRCNVVSLEKLLLEYKPRTLQNVRKVHSISSYRLLGMVIALKISKVEKMCIYFQAGMLLGVKTTPPYCTQ